MDKKLTSKQIKILLILAVVLCVFVCLIAIVKVFAVLSTRQSENLTNTSNVIHISYISKSTTSFSLHGFANSPTSKGVVETVVLKIVNTGDTSFALTASQFSLKSGAYTFHPDSITLDPFIANTTITSGESTNVDIAFTVDSVPASQILSIQGITGISPSSLVIQ